MSNTQLRFKESATPTAFSGYKWYGPETAASDERTQKFVDSINWHALCEYASKLHDTVSCTLDSDYSLGGRSMVRLIHFDDGSRWMAKPRMTEYGTEIERLLLQREFDCLQLVKDRTSVPVPAVFGCMASGQNEIGAPFILMECLAGNTAIEMNGRGSDIPPEYEVSFWQDVARIQAEISSITFPKIGSIIRLLDGTYNIGPLPKLGGPFDTATEYLKAWADTANFGDTNTARIRELCGERFEDISTSINDFPPRLKELAATIPLRNHGPFPLYHPDFGHQNIIVDDIYNILGVIDWEDASTVPWEIIDYPMTFGWLPVALLGPGLYKENGELKYGGRDLQFAKREGYVKAVREMELETGVPPVLSDVLADVAGQDLAATLRRWNVDRAPGFYTNVLDVHYKRYSGESSGRFENID